MSDSSPAIANTVAEYQANLLYTTERFLSGSSLSKSVRRAFLDTPRHLFVPRFYSSKKGAWIDLADEDLREHLDELYADHPLGIYRDHNQRTLSTISQPSLVLYMLDLLDIQTGMRVFELGGGSGWNAAMMGRIVGAEGRVVSVEIIESLARTASETIAALGLSQVEMIAGDGSHGVSDYAPFQRGVYTASAWDLPECFFDQMADGSLLLFVLKVQPSYDLLVVLRKTAKDTFTSEFHFPCSFVPVVGSHAVPEDEPVNVKDLTDINFVAELEWADIKIPNTDSSRFCEFVKVIYDCQKPYLVESHGSDFAEEFSGFTNESKDSLILFNEDRVLHYGSEECLVKLRRAGKRWSKATRPKIEDLKISIHKLNTAPKPSNDQWIVNRGRCSILWSL